MANSELLAKVLIPVVVFAKELLLPTMLLVFIVNIVLRLLVYIVVARQQWFASEFAKRVDRFVEDSEKVEMSSFFVILKEILESTYYEVFRIRGMMMRRRHDYVASLADRLFLVQKGSAMIIRDLLKQVRFLKHGGDHPKMLAISRNVIEDNPCFNRVMGVFPAAATNEVLNLIPGLFVVGGIFGTFLGIMAALPKLQDINLDELETAKKILDSFLLDVSYSMGASIIGIMLFVLGTLWNALFNPERKLVDTVNKFENCLDTLWNRSQDNVIPEGLAAFDERAKQASTSQNPESVVGKASSQGTESRGNGDRRTP